MRASCDALHCGRRPYLRDDWEAVRLDEALIAAPPIELWPEIVARVPVPEDIGEQGYMPAETAEEILQMLKEERQEMIKAAVTYGDEPDEGESPEAFQARMQELVERWKALGQESKTGHEEAAQDL